MTSQMGDWFEYNSEEYCLMGYTGGELPTAQEFGMNFSPGSTADGRGHCMWYGIEADILVVKCIEIRGEEDQPINHAYKRIKYRGRDCYDVGHPIVPLTGYLLFSDVGDVAGLYLSTLTAELDHKYVLFEVETQEGHITRIDEISDRVREKTLKPDSKEMGALWQGQTKQEQLANLEYNWDVTAEILSRRYDSLYRSIWYVNFREHISKLRNEIV